jgi:hypothetical protein
MEEEIDFFEFAEKLAKYEEQLPGVEFSLEQKQGSNEYEEIWSLNIFGETKDFVSLDDALMHLDGIIEQRN